MARWSRRQALAMGSLAAVAGVVGSTARANGAASDQLLAAARSMSVPGTELILLVPQGCEANLEPVIRQFSEATGVSIRVTNVAVAEINTRLLLANGRNERIDVALPATYGLPSLVEAGALLALDGVRSRVASPARRSLYELGDVYDGRVYGLQTDGDVYVMFYNRAMLEDPRLAASFETAHGYPPAPAQTFAELDRLLRHFHAPDQDRYGGALFRSPGYLAWEWWIRFHAKGRWPFDDNMRPNVDSPEGIAASQEMVSATRFLHPDVLTAGLTENWRLFATGNIMCNIGWGGSQKFFRSQGEEFHRNVLVGPTPGARFGDELVEFGHFNWGWNYAVPRTSAHPQLGALFATFATEPDVSTQAVRAVGGFFDPFHAVHFEDPEIERVYGRNFLDVQRRMLETAIPDLYLPGKTRYLDVLDGYLLRASRGEAEPASALRSVASLWDAVTDELGRDSQIERWRALRQRYPQALRERLR